MTGAEHYMRAEKLLHLSTEEGVSWRVHRNRVRAAHVHATLALAAATAQNIRRNGAGDLDVDWINAIGGGS